MNDHAKDDWEAEIPQGSIWIHRMAGTEVFVCGHSWATDTVHPLLLVLFKETTGEGNLRIPNCLERDLFQHRYRRIRPNPERGDHGIPE